MTDKKQDTRPVFMGTYLKNKSITDSSMQQLEERIYNLDVQISKLSIVLLVVGVISVVSFCLAIL